MPVNKDFQNKNLTIGIDGTIKDAMVAMNDNQRGAIIVIDDNFHMVGVVSDGELRRALVSGRDINAPIEEIVNLNPIFILENDERESFAEDLFAEHSSIHLIPVVDKDNTLIDIVIRNPQIRK